MDCFEELRVACFGAFYFCKFPLAWFPSNEMFCYYAIIKVYVLLTAVIAWMLLCTINNILFIYSSLVIIMRFNLCILREVWDPWNRFFQTCAAL